MRIVVCDNAVPFVSGGGERLRTGLVESLRTAGHETDLVTLPFRWYPPVEILSHLLAWRLADVLPQSGGVDRVITLRFPAYAVRHPSKVGWIMSQHRTAYELWGTEFGDLEHMPHGAGVRSIIHSADDTLLREHERLFTLSSVVRERMLRNNGIDSAILHPPIDDAALFGPGTAADFVLYPARLDRLKRHDLLIEAMAQVHDDVRCIITGTGPQAATLLRMAHRHGVADRIEFTGHIPRERLIELYSRAVCVFNGPYDEDFGYVTIEALLSGRPVVTTTDSGGPLQWVEDGRTGWVVPPTPEAIATAIAAAAADPDGAAAMGMAGRADVLRADMTWDRVVERLTE